MPRLRRRRDRRSDAERTLTAALAWARLGIGVAVWAAPRASMRALAFDPDDPQVTALARLGGTRDLALGTLALATVRDPAAAAAALRVNACVDALDALAFGIALLRREGIDRAALLGATSAAGAAVTGFHLASRAARAAV